MARLALAALLLASSGTTATASTLLYVSSYAGTITTLNTTMTAPPGAGKYPAMTAVGSNEGCKESPSWLALNHDGAVLYCVNEGFANPEAGALTSYQTNSDGTLTQLGKADTAGGPVSGAFYGCKGHGFAMAH